MGTRKIAIVASMAAVALALSGCNAGNAETPSASPSAPAKSSTAPASKTAASPPSTTKKYKPATADGPAENVPVPKMPSSAKKNSKEGAGAFAEYYFELINYVIQTNDATPLKQSTTRQCEVCGKSLIDPAGRAKISGKWQVGGEHTYKVVDTYKSSQSKAVVSVRFEVAPAEFYLAPNDVEDTKEKRPSKVAALGLEYDDGWKVYIIDLEKPSK